MKLKILTISLVILCLVPLSSAEISGLTVELVDPPEVALAGETIEVNVRILKPQGIAISGKLKTYITAKVEDTGGYGSELYGGYVALNEEGWGFQRPGNAIWISMDENQTVGVFTLRNTIMEDCPSVTARLKARLFNVNGDKVTKYDAYATIHIRETTRGVQLPLEYKALIGLIVGGMLAGLAAFLWSRGRETRPFEPYGEYPTTLHQALYR